MESKLAYAESPPSYTPAASTEFQPAATPGPTSFPSPGHQQYPPSSQYPGGQYPYGPHYGYDQQPAGYPPSASVRPQHQQQVVVVSAGQQQPIIVQNYQSYIGHVVFAVIVCLVCNLPCGIIALVLAG